METSSLLRFFSRQACSYLSVQLSVIVSILNLSYGSQGCICIIRHFEISKKIWPNSTINLCYMIWYFSSKTKTGPQFRFTGSWPNKSNFEGIKIFFGHKIFLGYPILEFLTPISTNKMIFFHQKRHNIGNISTCNFCDIFDEKNHFWYFQGSKILKWGTSNIFWGPKIFWPPQSWIFLGQDPVNWNWGPT